MFNRDDDRYFSWLVDIITPKQKNIITQNHLLLYILYTRPFLVPASVSMDINRMFDGLELRQKFIQETGQYRFRFKSDDCSILEMLVALTIRMEETLGGEANYRAARWFWELMENLGVKGAQDSEFIHHMLDIFINREYNYDGTDGGLFVIQDPRKDLTTTELWYQSMWYLSKNYL